MERAVIERMKSDRSKRTPTDYADRVIAIVTMGLYEVGSIKSSDEFESKYLEEVVKLLVQGVDADTLFARFTEEHPPEGKAVDQIQLSAYVAITFAIQAWRADEDGKIGEAWTYAMDGMVAAGSMANAYTIAKSRFVVNSSLNEKKSRASEAWKASALTLWENWQDYPDLYDGKGAFDKEVGAKLGLDAGTIRKWREQQQRERKSE